MPVLLNRHLQCDLGADRQVSGQWVSSNRSILSVNAVSGQAKAIGQGSAHGNYGLYFHAFSVSSWIFRGHYYYEMLFILVLIFSCISAVIFEGHDLKLQTKVTVLLGNTLYVDSPRETLTNVHVPAEGYSFPVKFRLVSF